MWRRFRRNRLAIPGGALALVVVVVALCAPWLAPYDPTAQDLNAVIQPPSHTHPLGTDELGRDLLSRIIYGARTSLLIAVVVLAIAFGIGTAMGAAGGWYGSPLDDVVMRIVDTLMAFPSILLALAIVAALGPGVFNVMLAVGVAAVPPFARVARAAVLSLRSETYVEAAQAIGVGNVRIVVRHLLPNSLGVLIVQATLLVATAIQTAAGLGFLGLGAQPPVAEWGTMLSDSRVHMRIAPYLVATPGLAIFITTMAFNLLGDGLRDALDVRLRP